MDEKNFREMIDKIASTPGGTEPSLLSPKVYKELERIISEGWEPKHIYSDVDARFYISQWDSKKKENK